MAMPVSGSMMEQGRGFRLTQRCAGNVEPDSTFRVGGPRNGECSILAVGRGKRRLVFDLRTIYAWAHAIY
jgi:hypothetical protein